MVEFFGDRSIVSTEAIEWLLDAVEEQGTLNPAWMRKNVHTCHSGCYLALEHVVIGDRMGDECDKSIFGLQTGVAVPS